MSKKTSILIFTGIVATYLINLALQNPVISNLPYVLTYDMSLARSSQVDTTKTSVVNQIDEQGRQATLISAFYGLDDALPVLSDLVVCEGANNADGMPVIFSNEVDVSTIEPGDFKVTTESGAIGLVSCLTLAPADDMGELRTALLVGQYGSIDDQPVYVEIIGNILSIDGSLNFKGASVPVTPLEAGPSMVWAEIVPKQDWSIGLEPTSIPFGGSSGCPEGTRQIVRVTWDGGITKPDNSPADDHERHLYKVTVKNTDSSTEEIIPFGLGDTHDGDNNHKLCLDTDKPAISVFFPAGYVTDPRHDLNPDTTIAITF